MPSKDAGNSDSGKRVRWKAAEEAKTNGMPAMPACQLAVALGLAPCSSQPRYCHHRRSNNMSSAPNPTTITPHPLALFFPFPPLQPLVLRYHFQPHRATGWVFPEAALRWRSHTSTRHTKKQGAVPGNGLRMNKREGEVFDRGPCWLSKQGEMERAPEERNV